MAHAVEQPYSLRMAEAFAAQTRCPRCHGLITVEPVYDLTSSGTGIFSQFRCTSCGWRDDVAYMGQLDERERNRQQRRQQVSALIDTTHEDYADVA